MNTKERLKKFCKESNIAISVFEKSISTSNGYVNSISKGIGEDKLFLILEKYPNLSVEWLLTGRGEMLKSDSLEVKKEVISSAEERVDRLLSIIESQQEVIKNLSEALIEADAQKECDAECADVG